MHLSFPLRSSEMRDSMRHVCISVYFVSPFFNPTSWFLVFHFDSAILQFFFLLIDVSFSFSPILMHSVDVSILEINYSIFFLFQYDLLLRLVSNIFLDTIFFQSFSERVVYFSFVASSMGENLLYNFCEKSAIECRNDVLLELVHVARQVYA